MSQTPSPSKVRGPILRSLTQRALQQNEARIARVRDGSTTPAGPLPHFDTSTKSAASSVNISILTHDFNPPEETPKTTHNTHLNAILRQLGSGPSVHSSSSELPSQGGCGAYPTGNQSYLPRPLTPYQTETANSERQDHYENGENKSNAAQDPSTALDTELRYVEHNHLQPHVGATMDHPQVARSMGPNLVEISREELEKIPGVRFAGYIHPAAHPELFTLASNEGYQVPGEASGISATLAPSIDGAYGLGLNETSSGLDAPEQPTNPNSTTPSIITPVPSQVDPLQNQDEEENKYLLYPRRPSPYQDIVPYLRKGTYLGSKPSAGRVRGVYPLWHTHNCTLIVTGIPVGVTYNELFDIIDVGSVYSIIYHPPDDQTSISSVELTFMDPNAAARFLAKVNSDEGLSLYGYRLEARLAEFGHFRNGVYRLSRILTIKGPAESMSEVFWLSFFETLGPFKIDRILDWGTRFDHQKGIHTKTLEFRFVRADTEAKPFRRAIREHADFKGLFLARYHRDPCQGGHARVPGSY